MQTGQAVLWIKKAPQGVGSILDQGLFLGAAGSRTP